jgi:hypothetical protein
MAMGVTARVHKPQNLRDRRTPKTHASLPTKSTDDGRKAMRGQQLHDYSEEEFLYNRFMEPALRQAMILSFPKTNARVLDEGCGPGGLFALLLEALGPSGALVAIDRSTPHLEVAKKLIDVVISDGSPWCCSDRPKRPRRGYAGRGHCRSW